jgi:hypothetical protein
LSAACRVDTRKRQEIGHLECAAHAAGQRRPPARVVGHRPCWRGILRIEQPTWRAHLEQRLLNRGRRLRKRPPIEYPAEPVARAGATVTLSICASAPDSCASAPAGATIVPAAPAPMPVRNLFSFMHTSPDAPCATVDLLDDAVWHGRARL